MGREWVFRKDPGRSPLRIRLQVAPSPLFLSLSLQPID